MKARKGSVSLKELRERSWRACNKGRCDFCGRGLGDERVKATHSSGLVFYLCVRCGVPILQEVASLPVW
jgi:hypothetical protein